MYRFFCCLLVCILLSAGCSRTAAPAAPDAPDPPSPTQDPPGEVDKETAQKLFESYILPYEAVTGGMPFSHPSELSNDLDLIGKRYARFRRIGACTAEG